jgi:hypothetical protein
MFLHISCSSQQEQGVFGSQQAAAAGRPATRKVNSNHHSTMQHMHESFRNVTQYNAKLHLLLPGEQLLQLADLQPERLGDIIVFHHSTLQQIHACMLQ